VEAIHVNDPEVLRAALVRESVERRRAECRADMQTEIAKLAHDLLVREPNIDRFFGRWPRRWSRRVRVTRAACG
jgi:hypothetical protein